MKKSLKYLVSITLLILFGFLIKAFIAGNFEFVGYWIFLVSMFLVVIKLSDKFKIPTWTISLFAIWSVLHMAGGLLKINGLRLYDFIFFNLLGDPFFILKYDQVLHTFCYFVISILIYFILKNYVKKNEAALITFTILSALGVGLLNEVLEFGMVVFLDAADAVGGYYNTALDLLFNLIGAIIGPFVARKFK